VAVARQAGVAVTYAIFRKATCARLVCPVPSFQVSGRRRRQAIATQGEVGRMRQAVRHRQAVRTDGRTDGAAGRQADQVERPYRSSSASSKNRVVRAHDSPDDWCRVNATTAHAAASYCKSLAQHAPAHADA
jgi:hypothetical protein